MQHSLESDHNLTATRIKCILIICTNNETMKTVSSTEIYIKLHIILVVIGFYLERNNKKNFRFPLNISSYLKRAPASFKRHLPTSVSP